MNSLPSAYIVHYKHNGQPAKFITLDHTRADQYAIEHHGIIGGLYELETTVPLTSDVKQLPENAPQIAPYDEALDNAERHDGEA